MKLNYWEMAAELTEDRMLSIASLLVRVRHDALATHEPDKGDSPWGFGCRVYDRCRNSIIKAAEKSEWLSIIDPTLHFVFAVGGVPVRFGNGDIEQPKSRLLRRRPGEFRAQQLAFDALGPEYVEGRWRIIYDTDNETMAIEEVVLVQANGSGDVLNSWPLDVTTTVVPLDLRKPTPAADVPALKVTLKKAMQGEPPARHA